MLMRRNFRMKRWIAVLAACLVLGAGAQNRPQAGPGTATDPWIYGPNNTWNPNWNQRPNPVRGACFFTTAQFVGNKFCVRSGSRLAALPGNFGDNISSIQIFGRARVHIFNDRNFSGGSASLTRSVSDLRRLRFRGGHTWNNRISSIAVSSY